YTYGVVVEFVSPTWALRGAVALMPKTANGISLDWNVARSRGQNIELELHPTSNLIVRTLVYVNRANMGLYTEAIDAFLAGEPTTPDISAAQRPGRIKPGV